MRARDGALSGTFRVGPLLAALAGALIVGALYAGGARAAEPTDYREYVCPPDDPLGNAGRLWRTDDLGNFWPATVTSSTPPVYRERSEPAGRGGRAAAVEALARRHFPPSSVAWAVRVAACESGHDLDAYSSGVDPKYGWFEHIGAWQISGRDWRAEAWKRFGGPLEDDDVNAAMAAWILSTQGPGAWPVCSR